MMKEGKLANGLLGSTALIVQKSHQINTESHLQPFFSSAFQNGLSNENSEITKAPIRLYVHSFSSASLKAFECESEGAHRFTTCLYSWESYFFLDIYIYTFFIFLPNARECITCTASATSVTTSSKQFTMLIYWLAAQSDQRNHSDCVSPTASERVSTNTVAGRRASVPRAPRTLLCRSQCLFKEVRGEVHEL